MVNRSALILIHGRGGSPGDWGPFQLQLRQHVNLFPVRYLTPDAPSYPFDDEGEKDKNALTLFTAGVEELKREVEAQMERGIPASQIALVGFDQGAGLVLGAAALFDFKIGGFFVISGHVAGIIHDHLKSVHKDDAAGDDASKGGANNDTPVFHLHGTADGIVPFEKAKATADFYKSLGFTQYNLVEIPDGKHSISPVVCGKLIEELPILFG